MARTARAALVVGPALAVLATVSLLPPGTTPLASRSASAGALTAYDGCDDLLADVRAQLVETATPYGWGWGGSQRLGVAEFALESGAVAASAAPGAGPADLASVGSGPTGTNLQEAGVDEPDSTKLADGLLVSVTGGALRVLSTGPDPQLLGRLALTGESWGTELLLDGDRALVLEQGQAQPDPAALTLPHGGGTSGTTTLHLADLSDPTAPRWLEEWTVDGSLVSARLTDGAVRVVTRSTPMPVPAEVEAPYGAEQEAAALAANVAAAQALPLEAVLPQASRRLATDGEPLVVRGAPAVACEDVAAPRDAAGVGLLLVTTLRPSQGLAPLDSTAVVASGDLVYAAPEALVVATTAWVPEAAWSGEAVRQESPPPDPRTELHLFATSGDTTDYTGSGEVAGTVLGRWALSWHEDALRVATTTGSTWGSGPASSSSVVVLAARGGALTEVGRVDGLGPGEQVQAVRYQGDLATVVTFRQTDPLYVLDLSDPTRPRLTGELKVPGFSTYLHPVGDDRLLGLGMEADPTGLVTGMQASVFDLSDRSAPTQASRLQLGQAWSEALSDSRAFTFDPGTGLVLLPIGGGDGRSSALALELGDDDVLRETGRLPLGDAYGARVLTDGDHAYAVGPTGVQVASLPSMAPEGALTWG